MTKKYANQKKYRARPIEGSLEWGTNEKGNDYATGQFEILAGERKGDVLTWYGYFSSHEGVNQTHIDGLKNSGCTFPNDDVLDTTGFGSKEVRIVVEKEMYQGKPTEKIRFINRAGGVPEAESMGSSAKEGFRSRMKAYLLSGKEGGAAAEEPAVSEEDIPI